MPSVLEQADGNWLRKKRGHTIISSYHQWLKKGRNRLIRRMTKLMLKRGQEPPRKVGYKGWES